MSVYEAYGVTIAVPFACPALVPVAGAPAMVELVEGDVPVSLTDRQAAEGRWEAAPGRFLFRGGRHGARFLVCDGQVVMHRNAEAEDTTVARQFTDRVLPALLQQRGLLVLHANAVDIGGRAVVLAGESGAGKSTTAHVLVQREALMLADDVTAVARGANGDGPWVLPGVAQTHLTEDAAATLGVAYDQNQLQPWRRMKAAIRVHGCMARGPAPLHAVVVLATGDRPGVTVRPLQGRARFLAWQDALYGPTFASDHRRVFGVLATALDRVATFRVERPTGRWSAEEVANRICALVPHASA